MHLHVPLGEAQARIHREGAGRAFVHELAALDQHVAADRRHRIALWFGELRVRALDAVGREFGPVRHLALDEGHGQPSLDVAEVKCSGGEDESHGVQQSLEAAESDGSEVRQAGADDLAVHAAPVHREAAPQDRRVSLGRRGVSFSRVPGVGQEDADAVEVDAAPTCRAPWRRERPREVYPRVAALDLEPRLADARLRDPFSGDEHFPVAAEPDATEAQRDGGVGGHDLGLRGVLPRGVRMILHESDAGWKPEGAGHV